MKRLSLLFAAAMGFMACGDTGNDTETGTGGSIDSATTAPMSPADNTTTPMDTATMDTSSSMGPGSGGAITPGGTGTGSDRRGSGGTGSDGVEGSSTNDATGSE